MSAGGPAALHFALRHPGRCRGLIMVAAATGHHTPPANVASRLRIMGLVGRVPLVAGLLQQRIRADPERAAIRAIPDPDLRRATFEHPEAGMLLNQLQQSVMHRPADRIAGTLADIAALSRMPPFPFGRLEASILGLYGDADVVVAHRYGEAHARHRLRGW